MGPAADVWGPVLARLSGADGGRVVAALEVVAARFGRPRAEEPSAAARRRHARALAVALRSAEHALYVLEQESGLGRLRDFYPDLDRWRQGLEDIRFRAETLLREAERPGRPGPRGDRATRRMVIDVAGVLVSAGAGLSGYEDGLLAVTVRAVASRAGRRLPDDDGIRRLLRPAVRFWRGVSIPTSTDGNSVLTDSQARPLPSRQMRH